MWVSAGSVAERTTGSMSSAGGKEVVNWTKGREIEGLLAVGTSPGCQQRKRGCCTLLYSRATPLGAVLNLLTVVKLY